jgi:peptidyl-prolyl cis-trans isomerase C
MKINLFYRYLTFSLVLFGLCFSVTACGAKTTSTATAATTATLLVEHTEAASTATEAALPTLTPTPVLPTATAEPSAAMVNGENITLAEFQAELARYQAAALAANKTLPADADQKKAVLDDMIDQVLLAQAAKQAGHQVTDADVQSHIDKLVAQLGSQAALLDWEQKNGYDDAGFRLSLQLSLAAAWQRDQIIAAVPTTADQVHARQILVYTADEATLALERLKSGQDFATLARGYDPLLGGDLGWFPKGYLLEPEVEAAAFSLQPGDYSAIIQTKVGYHIIQVIERDPQRPLSYDALQTLQTKALEQWVADQQAKSTIVTSIS